MNTDINMLFWAGGSFLLGGIMFSQQVPKLLANRDISQESDDHNPGSVNVFKLCGIPLGSFCLLLDVLKGFLPVYFAKSIFPVSSSLFATIMAAPVLGHAMGIFNGFCGGKCIATAFGVLAALIPETWVVLLLGGLYVFFCVFICGPSMRAKSQSVFSLFGLFCVVYFAVTEQASFSIGCGLISAIVVYRHRKKGTSILKGTSSTLIEKS